MAFVLEGVYDDSLLVIALSKTRTLSAIWKSWLLKLRKCLKGQVFQATLYTCRFSQREFLWKKQIWEHAYQVKDGSCACYKVATLGVFDENAQGRFINRDKKHGIQLEGAEV